VHAQYAICTAAGGDIRAIAPSYRTRRQPFFELGSSGFTAAKKDQVAFVVASVKKDDTSWIAAFPEWSHHIYFIDDFYAYLRVPVNKGREAMVYLT
jgi:Protein of unknown function (DUF3431)